LTSNDVVNRREFGLKDFVLRELRKLGVDVRKARRNPNLSDFLSDRRIDCVLDVGANVGQFGAFLRRNGYRGKITSFEPVKAVFDQLTARARADGNWDTFNFALGASPGRAIINVSKNTKFSSFRKLRESAASFDQSSAVETTESVEVRTLDDVAKSMNGQMLVKVDTQGFERQVIEGGRATLPRLQGVVLELPVVSLYENSWKLPEAIEFMAGLDFVIAQLQPVNYHSKDRMSIIEYDCLFRPKDPRID
jgi:FkbM family methyltransferase